MRNVLLSSLSMIPFCSRSHACAFSEYDKPERDWIPMCDELSVFIEELVGVVVLKRPCLYLPSVPYGPLVLYGACLGLCSHIAGFAIKDDAFASSG